MEHQETRTRRSACRPARWSVRLVVAAQATEPRHPGAEGPLHDPARSSRTKPRFASRTSTLSRVDPLAHGVDLRVLAAVALVDVRQQDRLGGASCTARDRTATWARSCSSAGVTCRPGGEDPRVSTAIWPRLRAPRPLVAVSTAASRLPALERSTGAFGHRRSPPCDRLGVAAGVNKAHGEEVVDDGLKQPAVARRVC